MDHVVKVDEMKRERGTVGWRGKQRKKLFKESWNVWQLPKKQVDFYETSFYKLKLPIEVNFFFLIIEKKMLFI